MYRSLRLSLCAALCATLAVLASAPAAQADDMPMDKHDMSGMAGMHEMCPMCAADEASLQAAQAFFAAYASGDMDKVLSLMTDDIHWEFWGSPDRIALHGPRDGKAAVQQWFKDADATFVDEDFGVDEMYASGNAVCLVGHEQGHAKATGKPVKEHWMGVMKFTDGKLASFRGLDDSAQELWAITPDK